MKRLLTLLTAMLLLAVANGASADEVPKTRATAGGTLHLDTSLSHGWLPIGKPATVYATVSIKAQPAPQSTDRAPLNIALVLDRSTSMSGGKLDQAKQASHTLIDMLDERDRLAIASYGSDVTTHSKSLLATPGNKELLHNAVRSVRLSGSTNLSGGYERGRELVMPHNRDETVNRVLLLSDGHANVGVTAIPQLGLLARTGLDRGVSLTTMGIGLDYNEDLMTAMATEGAGNYYFIEDEKAIAAMFQKECTGLASTVARNTTLKIEMAPGVELLEVRGFAHQTKGNVTTVRLAEFFGNQQKDIVLKMVVAPQAGGRLPIVTSRLSFDDVTQSGKGVASTATLAAVATADATKLKDVDHAVLKRAKQVETSVAFADAMKHWEKGDKAKAAEVVAKQRAENKQFLDSYDFEDDEVQGFLRVDGEMEEMERKVKSASPSSTQGKRLRKAKKARSRDIAQEAAAW